MGVIYRKRNTRLAVKLTTAAIGWAVLRLHPAVERVEQGDVAGLLRAELAGRDKENGHIELYVYLDDESFVGSVAEREGMTREAHRVLVETHAQRLADEGWTVWIVECEQ